MPLFDAGAGMMISVSSYTCVWNPGTVGVNFLLLFKCGNGTWPEIIS